MSEHFKKVEVHDLEEGALVMDLQDALDACCQALIAHGLRYEIAAEGGKAALHLKIELELKDWENQTISIKTGIETKAPKRPAKNTMAIISNDKSSVKCRVTGTTAGDPHQAGLFHPSDAQAN